MYGPYCPLWRLSGARPGPVSRSSRVVYAARREGSRRIGGSTGIAAGTKGRGLDAITENNGTVFCTNCGQKLTPEDRFCPECGAARPTPPAQADIPPPPPPGFPPPSGFPPPPPPFQSTLSAPGGYGSFSGGMPMATMAPAMVSDSKPMLQFDVEYPESSSRLLVLARFFLGQLILLPHFFVLFFLFLAVLIIWPISWFAILILGRYPRGLWEFVRNTLRWSANVNAWYTGLRDGYPPFSGTEPYPVQFELAYPERLSRLLIFVKWLLVIPSLFVYAFVAFVAYLAMLFGWIAVLFVGQFPRGLFDFIVGSQRWGNRIGVYMFLLTDAYPPFRMDP
jgi:hypothetical protein